MIAYRIATIQVNTPVLDIEAATDSTHVSTVPLGEDEVADHLDAEAAMHAAAGWRVKAAGGFVVAAMYRDDDDVLVTRVIYAVAFDPADDGNPDIRLIPLIPTEGES